MYLREGKICGPKRKTIIRSLFRHLTIMAPKRKAANEVSKMKEIIDLVHSDVNCRKISAQYDNAI